MPIFDIDPGTLPETAGTLRFYRQGAAEDSGMTVTSDGTMTLAGGLTVTGAGGTRQIAKAVTTSRNTTVTPTDDPELTLSVVANAVYEVRCMPVWVNGGGGMRVTWNVPALSSMTWTDGGGGGYVLPTTNATFTASTGSEVVGRLVTGANAGACTLQWAQSTSNAGATVLQVGSFLSLRRVA
jgi:hypothetical protein